ncbi:MAG: autotransporter outer membrane beta-barrel domain-containing protein [Alphaproteobacteria bacterium]|nr:autotransporter outer membrane beta-barrel domain-containing protein [Alphaproteobacteria bacterium]
MRRILSSEVLRIICLSLSGSLLGLLPGGVPLAAQTQNISGNVTITVPGDRPSPWDLTGFNLLVGESGAGFTALKILDGGEVRDSYGYIGYGTGTFGTVSVQGSGKWASSGELQIGVNGTGTLEVLDGGTVTSYKGLIGLNAGSAGTVNVIGPGSSWIMKQDLALGVYTGGDGMLNIMNGGTVSAAATTTAMSIGNRGSAIGVVNIDGTGSNLNIDGPVAIGRFGAGYLNITNGGAATSTRMTILALERGSSGSVIIDGPGSKWSMADYLVVGYVGDGSMAVTGGGTVSSAIGYIGNLAGSTGTVTVTGQDAAGNPSSWINNGSLYVASSGTGSLTIADGGVVRATTATSIGATGGDGRLNIGAARGDAAALPGILDTPLLRINATGELVFNHSATDYSFSPAIAGQGQIFHDAGTTHLTGTSPDFAGQTTVGGGVLLVDGRLGNPSSQMTVESGGTIGGSGTIGGNVSIADGILAPGYGSGPTVLTITGDLVLSADSTINYHFGEAGSVNGMFNDLTRVGGNLTLAGTLNVDVPAGGSFDPGVYRIFDYGGQLTDQTLTLGTMPVPTSLLSVHTVEDGQVDLVYDPGADPGADLRLTFWDGDGGPKNNSHVDGGDGIWRANGDDNWTNSAGNPNAPYLNASFAVFAGVPGTVTVDNNSGQVISGGMQFMVSGYVIRGGAIELAAGLNPIRVGDGSIYGAGFVATIASELTGAGALKKSDVGTLILTGENSYSGGTTITAGTLQLGDGGTTGSIPGNVVNNGVLAFNRSDSFTFGGEISGTGGVNQIGPGTTILTAANTYSGDTTVTAGVLQAGSAGAFSAASVMKVGVDGTVALDRFSSTIRGLENEGRVVIGSGTEPGIVLTVTGNYTGKGGIIAFDTALGADNSPTDRLVVNGDTSGHSSIKVTNVGGLGARTTGNGIELVTVNGAANGSFSLAGRVAAGAYDYGLYSGGIGSDAGNGNEYLRSTIRPEVPVDSTVPALTSRVGLTLMGSAADRSGSDIYCADEPMPGRKPNKELSPCGRTVWGRLFGQTGAFGNSPTPGSSPSYSFGIGGVQAGADLFAGARDQAGFFAGAARADATVRRAGGGDSGKVGMDAYALGLYWSHHGISGWSTDVALQQAWYENIRATTSAGMAQTSGSSFTVSAATGYQIALPSRMTLLPQAQLIYQHGSVNGITDAWSIIRFVDTDQVFGRIGARLSQAWESNTGRPMTSWGEVNVWHQFTGDATTSFATLNGQNPLTTPASLGGSWVQVGVGLSGQLTRRLSAFGRADYTVGLDQAGHSIGGRLGLRVLW